MRAFAISLFLAAYAIALGTAFRHEDWDVLALLLLASGLVLPAWSEAGTRIESHFLRIALRAVLAGLPFLTLGYYADARLWIETILLVIVLPPFAAHPDVQRALASMPAGFRKFSILLSLLIVAGHVVRDGSRTFPFVYWGMYCVPPDSPVVRWYEVVAHAGEERVVINPERVFPALGLGTFRLGTGIAQLSGQNINACQDLVAAIARRHGSDRQVRYDRVELIAYDGEHGKEATRTVLFEVAP